MTKRLRLPETIDEAVDLLLIQVPPSTREEIASMSEDYLIWVHMDFGHYVRKDFGLYVGNEALMEATDQQTADEASWVIIEAMWRRLKTKPLHH